MSEKILFVDDDQKILNSFQRQFDDVLEFETAIGPEEALSALDHHGPFAVVVSDMRMPEMNGIELFARCKERSPDTVRIMLTGYADLHVTIEAVNEGNIFRFLSKPCPHEVLEKAIHDGLAQYRLITAERELLEGTLHGSIKVLSEMLSLVSPLAFGRTTQVQRIAMAIGKEMHLLNLWDLEIAAMLFPLGCVTVSESTLECAIAGLPLPAKDHAIFDQHAAVASRMLEKIPRLETVAAIVAYQDKCFDGSGPPNDLIAREHIPIGARILKVASDFEIECRISEDPERSLLTMQTRTGKYDPKVSDALRNALRNGLCQSSRKEIAIQDLATGMVLAADIRSSKNQQLMMTCGQRITDAIKQRLVSLSQNGVIPSTIVVEELCTFGSSELTELNSPNLELTSEIGRQL